MNNNDSIEPDFSFLKNSSYTFPVFGVFCAYAVLLACTLKSKAVRIEWYVILPILFLIIFSFLPTEFEFPIYYLIKFLDFPVSFIESYYFTRLVCFISRFSLCKLNPPVTPSAIKNGKLLPLRNTKSYQSVISIISIVSLTTATILITYGFEPWLLSWYHGVVAAGIVFAFLFTIVCDNGIISDPCMIALHTSLSLAPILSASAGFFTVFLRLALVVVSFCSLKFSLEDDPSRHMKGFSSFFASFQIGQISTTVLLLLLTFTFLSQEAFIRPSSRICGWQAMTCPIIYIFFLLEEARFYHVATPHLTKK